GRCSDRARLAGRAVRARGRLGGRGASRVRGRASTLGRARRSFARVRLVRHVPRLRGPRAPLQGGRRDARRRGGRVIDRLRRADPVLAIVPPLLACASLVLVYSASSILGITSYNDPYYFLFRRAIHLVIGLLAFAFFATADTRRLVERFAGKAYLAVLVLLAVLAILDHGISARGARR